MEEVNLSEEGRRREVIILSRILTFWSIFKLKAELGNKDIYLDCSCDLMFQIKNALHLDAEVKYKHNAEFGFLLYLQPVIVG